MQVITWHHAEEGKEVQLGVGYYRGLRAAGFGTGELNCVRGCKCFEGPLKFNTGVEFQHGAQQRWAFVPVTATPECVIEARLPYRRSYRLYHLRRL